MNQTRPTVAVAGIAFDASGRVLLVERGQPPGQGLWTVPGGKVEPGEHLAEALVREFREETGLAVEVGPPVDIIERMARDQGGSLRYHYVIVDFAVTVTGGELRAADDVADARWVSEPDMARLPLTEGLEPVIAKARRGAQYC